MATKPADEWKPCNRPVPRVVESPTWPGVPAPKFRMVCSDCGWGLYILEYVTRGGARIVYWRHALDAGPIAYGAAS